MTNASFKTLRKTFSFVTSAQGAFVKYLGRSEPAPFEVTEEMEQEVEIYRPFLSQVASSLRGFHDLVKATQHMDEEIGQEGDETNRKGDETIQEGDEANYDGEEKQTGCLMAAFTWYSSGDCIVMAYLHGRMM